MYVCIYLGAREEVYFVLSYSFIVKNLDLKLQIMIELPWRISEIDAQSKIFIS